MRAAGSEDLLHAGRAALAAAEWETPRACFEHALALDESAEALDGLGDAVHWLGEYERALDLEERAFVAHRRAGRALAASEQAPRAGVPPRR